MSKYNRLVSLVMIFASLVLLIFAYIGNEDIITEREAIKISEAYFLNVNRWMHNPDSLKTGEVFLTNDLLSYLTQNRRWIVQKGNVWAYIDAKTGKLIEIENYEFDSFYIPPSDFEEFKMYFSWLLLILYYIIAILLFIKDTLPKKNLIRILSIIFVVSVVFLDLVTWIIMNIILVVAAILMSLLGR